MGTTRLITLGAIAIVAARSLEAQTPPKVAGVWTVHSVRVYKNLHTGDTTTVDESAQMMLRARGDSLFGYWQWPSSPGEPAPEPRTVRGTLLPEGGARVQVELEHNDDEGFFTTLGREIVEWLKTHVHNSPTTIPVFEFTVRGDSLIGTRRAMVPADGTMGVARPFYAVRVKS